MKYLNIFLLFLQHVVNFRSRIFVWFISSILNPLSLLIFWIAVFKDQQAVLGDWSISSIATYYFIMIIAGAVIIAHIEEEVAVTDIREGQLALYLTKPISYYWMKFFDETPWRIFHGVFSLGLFAIFYLVFSDFIILTSTFAGITTALIITLLAFFIAFTFKMILGLTAFWIVDFWGLQQLVEVIMLVLAGFLMPIELFPDWLSRIAHMTPFPYLIYYPIVAIQSKLSFAESINVIIVQVLWMLILVAVYKMLWRSGIKKFTGVGQ